MQLININLNLKQKIQQHSVENLMLLPGEIAGFLAICNEALIPISLMRIRNWVRIQKHL